MKHVLPFNLFEDRSSELSAFVEGLDAVKEKYEKMGVRIDTHLGHYESLYLGILVVPEKSREEGIGTAFMKELCELADTYKIILLTSPEDSFGGTLSRLNKFYKRFGFVFNKGRQKDFRFMCNMYRLPSSI